MHYREATADDAAAIAGLHADSWRRNYRGAFLEVLEQNTAAQAFYRVHGGVRVERLLTGPFPGGGHASTFPVRVGGSLPSWPGMPVSRPALSDRDV